MIKYGIQVCHSTIIELFYFDDNFRRITQWVPPYSFAISRITTQTLLIDLQVRSRTCVLPWPQEVVMGNEMTMWDFKSVVVRQKL